MYRYWIHTFTTAFSSQEIEDTINGYARQGWRLVSTNTFNNRLYLFFERQD